jgi:predicted MPP superfamily phosphohydrolase
LLAFALIVLIAWVGWSNLSIEVNGYTVESSLLPQVFDGLRIAHISDLHNAQFGKNNSDLIKRLRESKPDIIAITGDSVDSRHTNFEITLNFIEQAMDIAPCYFVVGNHESRFEEEEYQSFENRLIDFGVIVLHNEAVNIERGGEKITICGVDDPMFDENFSENLKNCAVENEFTILLSHRPESFAEYVENGYNLVLSGHGHGGQFRIPFLGGLYVPGQGFFPEFDAGIYTDGNTNMIVSRGIGNSVIPIRINNSPEVIIIDLKSDYT